MVNNLAIVGKELRFRDSSGQKWAYEGSIVQTNTSKPRRSAAISGSDLLYVDEFGDIRKAPARVDGSVSGKIREVDIVNSQLKYISDTGSGYEAHADVTHQDSSSHNDIPHDDDYHNDHDNYDHDDHDNSHSDSGYSDYGGIQGGHTDNFSDNHSDHDDHDNHDDWDATGYSDAHDNFSDHSDVAHADQPYIV